MSEKVAGYLLLIAGVMIILFCGVNVYMVFTNKLEMVNVFRFPGIFIDSKQLVNTPEIDTSELTDEQARMVESMIENREKEDSQIEILPGVILNRTSNLIAHVVLMGFLASIGYKLASLGVLMLRPIVVKLKEKKDEGAAPSPSAG